MKRTSLGALTVTLAIILGMSLLGIGVLGMGMGCSRKPDDARISSDIQGKFSQDSGLSTKQLTVQANNGVVTLGGTVDNDVQREAASRQAASVGGVREVVNDLKVVSALTAALAAPSVASIATATPASVAPRADKPKSGGGRKVSEDDASKQAEAAANAADNSNVNQESAASQPASEATPRMPPASADNPAAVPPSPSSPAPKRLIVDPGT